MADAPEEPMMPITRLVIHSAILAPFALCSLCENATLDFSER
jgi:hypothetical protein